VPPKIEEVDALARSGPPIHVEGMSDGILGRLTEVGPFNAERPRADVGNAVDLTIADDGRLRVKLHRNGWPVWNTGSTVRHGHTHNAALPA
jgi:hypothetical protein